jgi:hypothetical protein
MNTTDYTVKIRREGRQFAYTITTPDRQVAVRESGFFKRDACQAQAEAGAARSQGIPG